MAGENRRRPEMIYGAAEGFPRRELPVDGGIGQVSVRPREYFTEDMAAGQGPDGIRPGRSEGGSGFSGDGGSHTGNGRVVTGESIREAMGRLEKYREAKKNLTERVKQNEDWWRLQQLYYFRNRERKNTGDPEPVSAWLFNSVINKHADMLDNYPEPAIIPREESDAQTAAALTQIVPAILERNDFEDAYSRCSWDKLKKGVAAYGIFWNNELEDGLGDIEVRRLDILSLYWEPGISNIQDSKDLFITAYFDREVLERMYPDLKGKIQGNAFRPEEYHTEDAQRNEDKVLLVDWYYKRNYGGKTLVHLCKFCSGHILFASENEQDYTLTGYYAHGQYPVEFDVMFPLEASPAGFGYIDIMRSPQEYIDRMDASILKNGLWGARPRYWVSDSTNVNAEEFADVNNDLVGVSGSLDDTRIRPIEVPQLAPAYLTVRQNKIDELKETSGNRDFSQGTTSSGVTAASAIAALQEAGSKTSRDLNKASYRTFVRIIRQVLELIRQFYTEDRSFRILGENARLEYVRFNNQSMQPEPERESYGEMIAGRRPIYDIKVRAQKSSPFSRLSQNELAIQLYNSGVFNPELADQAMGLLEMMDFEGKDKVVERVQKNRTLLSQVQWLTNIALQAAQIVQQATGDGRILAALSEQLGINGAGNSSAGGMAAAGRTGAQPQAVSGNMETDSYGMPVNDRTQAGKARQQSAERADVR